MADGAPSEPDIFLSYAREDEGRARQLATALEQQGYTVFWDREVPPGQTWHSYIGQALVDAKCVVVAWSRHSIASEWVIEEASEGKRRKVLVPVLFEAVQPPFGFGGIQAASLVNWRPGRPSPAFDRLVAAVRRIVGGQTGSGIGPAVPDSPRSDPGRPIHQQSGAWSRRTVLAMTLALVAMAGSGATLYWWSIGSSMPDPEPSEPAPEIAPPAALEPPPPAPVTATEAPSLGPWEPEHRSAASTWTQMPTDEVRDCEQCPLMISIPAGEFTMGSPPDEPGRDGDEGPQRKVTISAPFWVGKYEVTFAEWDACVAAGGCRTMPSDNGWGRDNRPVINVSWYDAKEYVSWLNQKTRKTYWLLREVEWEYVARAGTASAYWWGDEVGRGNANCADCGSGWDNKSTAPLGSFAANIFGLHDTAGNVWEWIEDCWHDSYDGAPNDGMAWTTGGNCGARVLRGGSWFDIPRHVRSAERGRDNPQITHSNYGFRVARASD